MDPWFIGFIALGAIALLGIGIVPFVPTESEYRNSASPRGITIKVVIGIGFLAAVAIFLSSFTVVGTKTVGVTTDFGKPGAVLNNGWHWKTPTAQVHKFDASLQSDHYSSDKDDAGDPITVRLFTGAQASLNVTFQWKLEDDANFVAVFTNYREPQKIQQNLVKRALQQALNDQFAQFNPYTALIAAQATDAKPGTTQVSASFDAYGAQALTRLQGELAPQGVQAVSLTVASIAYDGKTQNYLDSLSQALVQTQIAVQNEKTAHAQAAANNALNGSAASPATVQQLCIQATEKVLDAGHTLPAGWSCSGASNTVVVPSTKG
jgi:regulator of protease activity HflC (stomatin/prohibitin superfamily)